MPLARIELDPIDGIEAGIDFAGGVMRTMSVVVTPTRALKKEERGVRSLRHT